MTDNNISSANALVYYVEKISKDWSFDNPYYQSLNALFHSLNDFNLEIENSKQQYHIIAQLIQDELNDNIKNIKLNVKYIEDLINEYNKNLNQNIGDLILSYLFFIYLLKLLNKNTHYSELNNEIIKKFLSKYNSDKSININYKKILEIKYLNVINDKEFITNDYELALEMLYKKILISNNLYRKKEYLMDFYIKQNKIENININYASDKGKSNLLEIVLILKAINNEGLYIPELEKENYISTYANEIIREKYLDMISEITSVNFKFIKISNWLFFIIIIIIELIIVKYSDFITIPLGFIEIDSNVIDEFGIYLKILLNGLILLGYILYLNHKTIKKVKELKW